MRFAFPPRRVEPAPEPIATPCVKHCVINQDDGLCDGCARSLDEIARWGSMTVSERQQVMLILPQRRKFAAPGTS